MLPAKNRLDRAAIQSFPKKTLTVYNDFGSIKAVSAWDFRMAVVTSSKHEKRAVVRNRVRRRIYTIFRNEDKVVALPFHILFYVSKKSYSASYGTTNTETIALIKKLRASSRVV